MSEGTNTGTTEVDLSALNYTLLVPYNGTDPRGGDSLTSDLNIFYQVSLFGAPRVRDRIVLISSFAVW